MDIQNIIEKYGPEISKTLKIATTELYAKILWYVQVDGMIGIFNITLSILLAIIIGYITHLICKRNKVYSDPSIVLTFYCIAFLAWTIVTLAVIQGIIPNITKIIAPEYWIINQILNK